MSHVTLMPRIDADIVCARSKNHYDPQGNLNLSDTATQTSAGAAAALQAFITNFKPLHSNQSNQMYFM